MNIVCSARNVLKKWMKDRRVEGAESLLSARFVDERPGAVCILTGACTVRTRRRTVQCEACEAPAWQHRAARSQCSADHRRPFSRATMEILPQHGLHACGAAGGISAGAARASTNSALAKGNPGSGEGRFPRGSCARHRAVLLPFRPFLKPGEGKPACPCSFALGSNS